MAIKKTGQNKSEDIPQEKLLAEIERLKKELKKRKKYGLVWEDKPEDVVEMCKIKLPVLKEVKGREIMTDKNKPVNLLIEGDNYHALSVLNYTHAKKIDVIYIDPEGCYRHSRGASGARPDIVVFNNKGTLLIAFELKCFFSANSVK